MEDPGSLPTAQRSQGSDQPSRTEHKGLLRSAGSVSLITTMSRVIGLVREQLRAQFLGTSMASDAFGIAFMLPGLMRRLVAEGAVTAGLVPMLTQVQKESGDEAAFAVARRLISLVLLVVMVVTSLGVIGAGGIVAIFALLGQQAVVPEARELTVSLTRVMFPFIATVSVSAALQSVLNTFRIFWVSALAPVVLNVAVITAALTLHDVLGSAAYAFGLGVVIGGVLQVTLQVPFVYRLGFRFRPDFTAGPHVRRSFALLVPTMLGASAYTINLTVSNAIAWGLGNGAVSSLQYSARLVELTFGVFALALSTVILPALSLHAARGQRERAGDTLRFAIRLTCFVCFPATAGLFLLREETVSLLFERGTFSAESTAMTSHALAFHIVGLTFIACARVFNSAFYAFRNPWAPLWAALLSLFVNVILCYALAPVLGHGGIALANTGAAALNFSVLAVLLMRNVPMELDWASVRSVALSAVATAVMFGVIWGARSLLVADPSMRGTALLLPCALLVGTGIGVYVVFCWICKHPEIKVIVAAFGPGRRRSGGTLDRI